MKKTNFNDYQNWSNFKAKTILQKELGKFKPEKKWNITKILLNLKYFLMILSYILVILKNPDETS